MLFSLLTSIFDRSPRADTKSRQRFRPALEPLGVRVVPSATDLWTDATGDHQFGTAANWQAHQVPRSGDSLVFEGPIGYYTSGPCNNLTGTFGGITVTADYASTITLSGPVTADTLTLAGGTIDRPAGGDDITVNTQFTWTGGVLNSTSNEAAVTLLGNNTITLPAAGALTCGDSVDFSNGNPGVFLAMTTISGAGALNFSNGSLVAVEAASVVTVDTTNAGVTFTGPAASYTNGKASVQVNNGGTLTVTGPGPWDVGNRTLVNNGGGVNIEGGSTVTVGGLLGPPGMPPLNTDILQKSGSITIHSGCKLTSAWGAMVVQSGNLFVAADGGAAGTTAAIGCQLTVSGGTIRILTNIGTLQLLDNFYWTGGTFQQTVDCTANLSDQIQVGKKLFVGGAATLQVLPLNYNAVTGLGVNFTRTVITAAGGISNFAPNQQPSLTLQNPVAPVFQVLLGGNTSYNLIPGPGQQ